MTSASRPRRSDATRAAILNAARERFAADGYDRTTIRAVAADARIDPAMVMRYFGSKQQLFAAAADFDLRIPAITGLPPDQVGSGLAAHFLDRWEDSDSLQVMLRSAATNEAAAEHARRIFAEQVTPAVAALEPDPEEAAALAALVAAQLIGLAMCRYVLRLPPVVAMGREELVARYGPLLESVLTSRRTGTR
ncbi:TetR/AcrR family transcriptional regulator [Streptacidiphilus griseoplanus]|uniref:TetR/AcrR family transcriptional regulator n=1 Tax=Peterkaempfera griseoplana TaxID=66896 RepID=UPI00099E23DE|nr:TetR family transcriptional regulator [Peterkaempfera griseoplana]